MNISHHNVRLASPCVFAVTLLAGILLPHGAGAEHGSFEHEIMPIIKDKCLACHQPGGDGYKASGLDLRTYEGLMKGTRHGPIVVPGDAFTSNLNVLIEGRAARHLRMPFHGKELSKWERHIIRLWVTRGAKDN